MRKGLTVPNGSRPLLHLPLGHGVVGGRGNGRRGLGCTGRTTSPLFTTGMGFDGHGNRQCGLGFAEEDNWSLVCRCGHGLFEGRGDV